ncbi:MAG: AI-2E family transporter [Myxococcaceae bacterium]|nr:AI-2E family transporter [Myxococcaceae bacterium]
MALSHHSQVSPRTVWTVGLHVLAIMALGLMLFRLASVLTLLALALMLALALEPLVGVLERLGLKRGWSVLLTLVGLLGLLALVGLSIVPMVVEQVLTLSQAIPGFITRVRESQWMRSLDARFGVWASVERGLPKLTSTIVQPVLDVLSSSLGALVTGLTVLTLSVFGLLSGQQLFEQGMRWVKPERRPVVRELLLDMNRAVSGYLVGVFLICALGSVVTGVFTWVLGVPYFLALGMMYLVLGFIPYVGSLLVAITVSITTLATVGFRRALIALALFLVYQQIEGNVIQPLIQRRTLKMNPLLIAIVVIVGAMLLGVLGAVLALPLAAALQVLLQRIQAQRTQRWEREARELAPLPEPPPPAGEEKPPPAGPEEPLHH